MELTDLIEASAVPVPAADHRRHHSRFGDFSRWGRRGGLATLAFYGRPWFSLLGRRRWGKVGAGTLARYRVERLAAKKGAA